jgi:hypothetical protein
VRIVFEFFESVDNARAAVFDQGHLEVDEQAKTLVGEPEIGQKLFLVDRGEQLHGFDFHDHLVFNDQVCPESRVDADILVDHRNRLPAYRDPGGTRPADQGERRRSALTCSSSCEPSVAITF